MTAAKQEHWKKRTIIFLISQSVTLFGSTLVQMAIIWYVTLNTSSGVWVAAFSVGSYLPEFLVSFWGGVWADRYDRKRLIMGADFVIAMVTLAMILLMSRISEERLLLVALLVMSAIRSLGAGVQTPAVNAVIPQFVPDGQRMRFNGINAAMQAAVRFAAPAVAGALMTVYTLREGLSVDILTAVLGIGILFFVRIPFQKKVKTGTSMMAELKEGILYAFSDRQIGRLLTVYGLFVFLSVPAGFLAGLFVSRVHGDTYGYLTLAELAGFAGMMIGGLLMSIRGVFRNRKAALLWGLTAFGAMAAGMGMAANFLLYLVLMLLYGVALTVVQTAITTLLQEKAEASMQGRVFGLLGSMYSGFLPAGMAIFGTLADRVPLQWIMAGSGMMLIAAAVWGDRKHAKVEESDSA